MPYLLVGCDTGEVSAREDLSVGIALCIRECQRDPEYEKTEPGFRLG